MKILTSILKTFVDIPEHLDELTNQKIIEVESYLPVNEATDLIVGHVLTCEKHPDSNHLHVTTVDLGDRVEQIVCGAPNVAKGQYVIVAQVGSILPGNFEIKAAKIRGVESRGMICSLSELGIEESMIPSSFKDGIFYFDEPKQVGKPALKELSLEGYVMELKLTPNRSDLLSHLGFAYDVASMTHQEVKKQAFNVKESSQKNPIQVIIETDGCLRYYARHFENIEVKESPWWLKSRLMAYGIHPINNVVDISNYVLIEYGTPLHMFDHDKLTSDVILVRDAKEAEEVITLDGNKRTLTEEDVVITNHKEVIAIGGVMGLENTMIDHKTTRVVLEAALFDPKRIQKTVKRLGLRSESSLRFERGIDYKRVKMGLERATELLIELASATVSQGITERIHHITENPHVEIPKSYFSEALGVKLSEEELLAIFKVYNYMVERTKDTYILQAPSYRNDLLIAADFLEEVARMYGLDKIPMTPFDKPLPGKLTPKQKRLRHIRHHLSSLGLYEVITYSLIKENEVHRYNQIGNPISILMPLSEDKKTLRQSLVHGLLEVVNFNQSRRQDDVAIFEIGNCFAEGIEDLYLSIALSGKWHENPWKKEGIVPDFYVLKGIVEHLFDPMNIQFKFVESSKIDAYHPYRQAEVIYQDQVIGRLTEVHPSELKRKDIQPTYVFEINLKPLLEDRKELVYQSVSKYPTVTRDLACVVKETYTAGQLMEVIQQTARKNLKHLEIFDIYQGSSIEKGYKSLAFSFIFGDDEKTLSAEDVDAIMKKITKRLEFEYQAVIRS